MHTLHLPALLCIAEIVLLMRISSWNFVHVSKAMFCAHIQSFTLKFSPEMWFLALCIFREIILESSWNVVKQPSRSTWGGRASGTAALCGCRFLSSLQTRGTVNEMSHILGEDGLSRLGRESRFSKVKALWNRLFRISALSWSVYTGPALVLSVGTPTLSLQADLM